MTLEELEPIVRAMQAAAAEANIKRTGFQEKGYTNLFEQSLGEAVGVGKCLQVLVDLYPDEMNELTKVVE